jgi:hypothetical protein
VAAASVANASSVCVTETSALRVGKLHAIETRTTNEAGKMSAAIRELFIIHILLLSGLAVPSRFKSMDPARVLINIPDSTFPLADPGYLALQFLERHLLTDRNT